MAFHTLEMISKVADEPLVKAALELFEGNKDKCEEWFNSEVRGLGYETPYDFCRKGKKEDVRDLIGRIEHGVYS